MPPIKDILENWRCILLSLAALLVVVPALINSINDIWVAWQDLPIGEKEKLNNQLFQMHWKENPIHTEQIVIEGEQGKTPITLDIYDNGDIFVDYGSLTQWFPYSILVANSDFQLVRSAYAGFFDRTSSQVQAPTKSIQNVRKSDRTVERTRVLEDGSKEVQTIDINSGKILSIERFEPEKKTVEEQPPASEIRPGLEVIKLPAASKDKIKVYELKEQN